MKAVVKWGLGTVAALLVLIVALYVGTRGDYQVAALVTQDDALPSRWVAGVQLHLKHEEGPPGAQTIVVLHGGPGGDFRSLLELSALSDTHHVVFYDQRGSGLSERVLAEQLTLDGYLEELDEVIALMSPQRPVVLIGHSWGAMLASAYMGAHRDKVAGAILIEPGFLDMEGKQSWEARSANYMSGGPYVQQAILNGFRAAHVTGPDDEASDDFLIGRMVGVFANHPENPYHCGTGYTAPGWRFGALASALWRDAPERDLGQVARGAKYLGPVLLMAGACNDWTGPSLQKRHAALFRNAILTVIPEAGHNPIWDNPDATIAAIRTFLANLSGR